MNGKQTVGYSIIDKDKHFKFCNQKCLQLCMIQTASFPLSLFGVLSLSISIYAGVLLMIETSPESNLELLTLLVSGTESIAISWQFEELIGLNREFPMEFWNPRAQRSFPEERDSSQPKTVKVPGNCASERSP